MIRFRPTQRSLRARLALAGAKAVGVTMALAVGFVAASLAPAPTPESPSGAGVDPVTRLIAEHRCSTTGISGTPSSAIIRRDGTVKHVTYDEGRAVREGRKPGALVAVCRAPVERG